MCRRSLRPASGTGFSGVFSPYCSSTRGATATLGVAAFATRTRPSRAGFAAVARVALASLLPGAVAVLWERRAHRPSSTGRHPLGPIVALLALGGAVNTTGTVLLLLPRRGRAPLRGAAKALDLGLLVGGDAIVVPYLALVDALHAHDRATAPHRPAH